MGTKHLTEADRLRARTLFFDAGLPKARICQITGFSLNQVKLAIREKTPKTRSGRPPRRRPGAAVAGGVPGSEASLVAGEHGHGEHGEDSVLAHQAAAAVHRPSERMPPLHAPEQQQQLRGHQHGHPQMKWDSGYSPQPPYYSSWPPPAPTPVSPGSTLSAAGLGPRGLMTPASPPLPPPSTTSMRMLSTTVGLVGIPSPPASSVTGSIRGRGDGGSVSSSVGGRRSDGHDFSSSSMSSSSLASSATSYSSSSGGGFSLPSILASATGP